MLIGFGSSRILIDMIFINVQSVRTIPHLIIIDCIFGCEIILLNRYKMNNIDLRT